jgi:hypothetical protein
VAVYNHYKRLRSKHRKDSSSKKRLAAHRKGSDSTGASKKKKPATSDDDASVDVCWACKKSGHKARYCTDKKALRRLNERRALAGGSRGGGDGGGGGGRGRSGDGSGRGRRGTKKRQQPGGAPRHAGEARGSTTLAGKLDALASSVGTLVTSLADARKDAAEVTRIEGLVTARFEARKAAQGL